MCSLYIYNVFVRYHRLNEAFSIIDSHSHIATVEIQLALLNLLFRYIE